MSLLHHSTRYSIKLGLALLTLSFGIFITLPVSIGPAFAQDAAGEKLPRFLNEYIQGRMQQEDTQSKVQVKGLVERDGRFYVSQETKLFVVATPRHPYLPINSISVKLDESDWYVYSGDTLHDVGVGDLSDPTGTLPPSAPASSDVKTTETALLNAKKTGYFSIPFISNRARALQVKATDILGNESAPFKMEVYVDVTPPYVEVAIESMDPMAGLARDLDTGSSLGDELPLIPAYREGDLFYVGPKYRITVDVFDTEAGVDKAGTALPGSLKNMKRVPSPSGGTIRIRRRSHNFIFSPSAGWARTSTKETSSAACARPTPTPSPISRRGNFISIREKSI